jgi:hypothetical protein
MVNMNTRIERPTQISPAKYPSRYQIIPENNVYTDILNIDEQMDRKTMDAVDMSLFRLTHAEFVILMKMRYNKYLVSTQSDKMSCLLKVADIEHQLCQYYLS